MDPNSDFLVQSFAHLPGIGRISEAKLWQEGYQSWHDLLSDIGKAPIGSADSEEVKKILEASIVAYEGGDHRFFRDALGLKDAWRAYKTFESRCCFLDIETDGGSSGSAITIIGLMNGSEFKALVRDRDLDDFLESIEQTPMVVTFYGEQFDLRMIEKKFTPYRFDQIHLDLCPTLRQLGIKGGLKKIEAQLGISRPQETVGLNGLDAIKLWNRFHYQGDEAALKVLIDYNREDVVNLKSLAEYAYDRLRRTALLDAIG